MLSVWFEVPALALGSQLKPQESEMPPLELAVAPPLPWSISPFLLFEVLVLALGAQSKLPESDCS